MPTIVFADLLLPSVQGSPCLKEISPGRSVVVCNVQPPLRIQIFSRMGGKSPCRLHTLVSDLFNVMKHFCQKISEFQKFLFCFILGSKTVTMPFCDLPNLRPCYRRVFARCLVNEQPVLVEDESGQVQPPRPFIFPVRFLPGKVHGRRAALMPGSFPTSF